MAPEVPKETRSGDEEENEVNIKGLDEISDWMQDNFATLREVFIKYIYEYETLLNYFVPFLDQAYNIFCSSSVVNLK